MLSRSHMALTAAAVTMFLGVTACSDDNDSGTNPPEGDAAALIAVIPQGGSTDVDPEAMFAMEFDGPMEDGMEMYAAMHMGDVTGPEVDGMWTWSEGHTHLGFSPTEGLSHGAEYTMHVGGGMTDQGGHVVDLETHGPNMGGDWATDGMMNPGGMGGHPHAGDGWQHENGSSGLVFNFTTAPAPSPAILVSVSPMGGDTGVDPGASMVVMFDHPMHMEMETYAALHEGDMMGDEVPGSWTWSDDGTTMTFTPDEPMMPDTEYMIHVGGGMMGTHGESVNFETHGPDMGGEWATGDMMDPGGMMGGHEHMGEGWQHENGTYGMVFGFAVGQ